LPEEVTMVTRRSATTKGAPEPRPSRRRFLATAAAGSAAGMAWLAERTPPAYAQRRTLTALALSLFVPSGDERLTELMQEFGKQAGVDVRFDTVKVTDVPVKLAAEATAQAGHDIVNVWEAFGYLHRANLANIEDVIEDVGKRYEVYPGHRATFFIDGHWKVAPWYWLSFVGTYNVKHFTRRHDESPTLRSSAPSAHPPGGYPARASWGRFRRGPSRPPPIC
jgi:ABC-type glycerol-3-phosphate transport system substrate-binding protein